MDFLIFQISEYLSRDKISNSFLLKPNFFYSRYTRLFKSYCLSCPFKTLYIRRILSHGGNKNVAQWTEGIYIRSEALCTVW